MGGGTALKPKTSAQGPCSGHPAGDCGREAPGCGQPVLGLGGLSSLPCTEGAGRPLPNPSCHPPDGVKYSHSQLEMESEGEHPSEVRLVSWEAEQRLDLGVYP